MNAYTTKTFRSGNSEAVRLPKELGFGAGVDVEVQREGDVVTIRRKRLSNRELVARLREIGPPPDGVQPREPIELPKRRGL
jgi:antitoxin VapB